MERYRSLQQQLENATDVRARYVIEQRLKDAEVDWASTDAGQTELTEKLAQLDENDMEAGRVQGLLRDGVRLRERLEKRSAGLVIFPASKLDVALQRIEKANRKLAQANVEDRFEYEVEEYVEPDGEGGFIAMVRLQVHHPRLEVEGWRFVAALDPDGNGGLITRPYPGMELDGYRPKEFRCDQCNSVRRRKSTYLVRSAAGEYKQVGSNCLHDFLGVKPAGLWALEWDLEENNQFLDRGQRGSIAAGADYRMPLVQVVATALAVVDRDGSYVSNSRAAESGRASTVRRVMNFFYRSNESLNLEPFLEKAQTIIQDTQFEGHDDYATNMRNIMGSEYVGLRHVGYAVSVIGAYQRQHAARTPPQRAVGYIAPIGEKFTSLPATVKKVFHTTNVYNGVERDVTMLVFQDSQGREVKWNASGYQTYREGEQVVIEKATVKDHDTYRDNQQTIVTRAKVVSLENDSDSEETY